MPPIRLTICVAGYTITADVTLALPTAAPQTVEEPSPREQSTTPTEDMILEVLRNADAPLKLVTIGHKAGHKNDAHFGKAMRSLLKKGLVVRHDGFRYGLAGSEE